MSHWASSPSTIGPSRATFRPRPLPLRENVLDVELMEAEAVGDDRRFERARLVDVDPGEAVSGELGDARFDLLDDVPGSAPGPSTPDAGECRPCHRYSVGRRVAFRVRDFTLEPCFPPLGESKLCIAKSRVSGVSRGNMREPGARRCHGKRRPAAVPREPRQTPRLSVRLPSGDYFIRRKSVCGCGVAALARDSSRANLCELRPGQSRHRKVLSCVRG